MMDTTLILLPATLIVIFLSIPQSTALISTVGTQTTSSCSNQQKDNSLACQLEDANLRIARLESSFGERMVDSDGKSQYLKECENKIEGLTAEIDRLKSTMPSFGDDNSRVTGKITALENEMRLLWDASRKTNFEVHSLEHKALEAERKLNEVASQVEQMNEIVTEQWNQMKQLEQAVYIAQLKTEIARKEIWKRCPFLTFYVDLYKDCHLFINRILDPYVPRYEHVLHFCKSQGLQIFSAAKQYHHELQHFTRQVMNSNELTAAVAHEEVVFFVASALVAFPIMAACMCVLSQFQYLQEFL